MNIIIFLIGVFSGYVLLDSGRRAKFLDIIDLHKKEDPKEWGLTDGDNSNKSGRSLKG